MNYLNDPRRYVYFKENRGADNFIGGIYGSTATFTNFTHIGTALENPIREGVLLDWAEVEFNLAEAVELGLVSGNAEMHYNNGITASFEYWNASGLDAYFTSADVAYATASGTWKQKIGKQYWLAMYNRGIMGWYVYRKFDAPILNIATGSELPVPKRYTYPVVEQTRNEDNYITASAAIGGDKLSTPIFWDIN